MNVRTLQEGEKYRLSNIPSNVITLLSSSTSGYSVTCTIYEEAECPRCRSTDYISIWVSVSVYITANSVISPLCSIDFFRSDMMTAEAFKLSRSNTVGSGIQIGEY